MNKVLILVIITTLTSCLSDNSSVNWTVNEIQTEYSGIVIDKYSNRKNDKPTHIKIKNNLNDKIYSIIPQPEIIKEAEIGDSIFKPKNENILYLTKEEGNIKNFFFIRIAKWKRKHKDFPSIWKEKWLSSSMYDTIN